MRNYWAVIAAAIITGVIGGCAMVFPSKEYTTDVRTLGQGWSDDDRAFFYRASQGTLNVPLAWLKALEQPSEGKGEKPLFIEPEYMAKLGFMFPGNVDSGKAKGLPLGFAVTAHPENGQDYVGFTCAACHTGQLNYMDGGTLKALRIDGGTSMHSSEQYRQALVTALIETHVNPVRFSRFAKRVLGEDASLKDKIALRLAVKKAVERGFKTGLTEALRDINPLTEGYGRLDALQRMPNMIFGYDLGNMNNLHAKTGPVSYPHLWDIWRLDWVQWNGSVRQPMARNIGEALGVSAYFPLHDKTKRYHSSIPVRTLSKIENTLTKLKPPAWPQDIWPVDSDKAAEGKALFAENCASCHGVKRIKGTEEWRTELVALDRIGTDPNAANNAMYNKVDATALGGKKRAGQEWGLQFITSKVREDRYKAEGVTKAEEADFDGFGRKNLVRAPCGYKARPLQGIWATAPFLHNGSVPNLYELLSPYEERSKSFITGGHMFDPVKVGLKENVKDGTTIDTSLPGNRNTGHIFDDNVANAIGRRLTEGERFAIIEFLKIYGYDDFPPEIVERPAGYPCDDTQPTYGG